MDIMTLIRGMMTDGSIPNLGINPRAQFGTRTRRYIGAEILPERLVPENGFREDGIKYRTVIANAGTRYSPSQKKGGALVGHMDVILAESDIASELTARDLDAIITLLNRNLSMDAAVQVTNFVNTTIVLALVELLELWRWQAIVNAQVLLRGDNEFAETVNYSNPANHRVNVAAAWSNVATDPMLDIFERVQLLANKGFEVGRIITSRKVAGIMAANPKMAARTNRIVVSSGGQIQGINGRVTLADINAGMQADGLPAIELYDLQYRTSTTSLRFMPDDVMVFIAQSGRDENLDLGDGNFELLPDTLGYTGIGRPAGQSRPGRRIRSEAFDNKPPRVENEGWQTALPVITEPEAVATLDNIT